MGRRSFVSEERKPKGALEESWKMINPTRSRTVLFMDIR